MQTDYHLIDLYIVHIKHYYYFQTNELASSESLLLIVKLFS